MGFMDPQARRAGAQYRDNGPAPLERGSMGRMGCVKGEVGEKVERFGASNGRGERHDVLLAGTIGPTGPTASV